MYITVCSSIKHLPSLLPSFRVHYDSSGFTEGGGEEDSTISAVNASNLNTFGP